MLVDAINDALLCFIASNLKKTKRMFDFFILAEYIENRISAGHPSPPDGRNNSKTH